MRPAGYGKPELPIEPEPYGTPAAALFEQCVSQPSSTSPVAAAELIAAPSRSYLLRALAELLAARVSDSTIHKLSRNQSQFGPLGRSLRKLALGPSAACRLLCRTVVFKGPPAP